MPHLHLMVVKILDNLDSTYSYVEEEKEVFEIITEPMSRMPKGARLFE